MYKAFLIILISLIAVITLCMSVSLPDMHKLVMVYDTQYVVADAEPKTVVTVTKPVEVKETRQVKNIQTENTIILKPQTKPIKSIETKLQTKVQEAEPVKVATKVQNLPKVLKNEPVAPIAEIKPEIKSQVQSQPMRQVKEEAVQQTPQEELILWNKWRSNIQNQLMKDAKTKLPLAPEGTEFRVSFDVDKYGKVANIHTSSSNPNYTNYAIQCIPPIVRSYQGHDILEFPNGSNRFSTTVECAWKVAQKAKYSTSKDYNDTEKVVK